MTASLRAQGPRNCLISISCLIHYFNLDLVSSTLISSKKPAPKKKILVKMKFIAVIVVAIAVSATADVGYPDTNEYNVHGYQTTADTYYSYQDLSPYDSYHGDELDMDVILPIAVFAGLGLGALAFVENLNFRNNLCEKLREITEVGRDAAANAAINANLADVNVVAPGNINNEVELNTLVNSNRIFINALAEIEDMDC